MNDITVEFGDGKSEVVKKYTHLSDILPSVATMGDLPIIAGLVNNEPKSLDYEIVGNCNLKWLSMASHHGWRVYGNTVNFAVSRAVFELFPHYTFRIEHSATSGSLYVNCFDHEKNVVFMSEKDVEAIYQRVKLFIKNDEAIDSECVNYTSGIEKLKEFGLHDKVNLLEFRNMPYFTVYKSGHYYDLSHYPIAVTMGCIHLFRLLKQADGFLISIPLRRSHNTLPKIKLQPTLFNVFEKRAKWGKTINVSNVGDLNKIVQEKKFTDFVLTCEAFHEQQLSNIAYRIAKKSHSIRFVTIAGPSSSGKTTFAKRLKTHLHALGITAFTLSTDDYFVGDEKNPVDKDGNPDYEHLEAVDLPLFNNHLSELCDGKEVELPMFNFAAKAREYRGNKLKLGEDQICIIEGIHGLNPRLTESLDSDSIYKIYISPLTQINLDNHNRISTTDNRLVRRMVRDNNFRNYPPIKTLKIWASVKRGEKKWIYPFQEEANIMFNSALDYELSVLKSFAVPLLTTIKPDCEEYGEAVRLLDFLNNFFVAPDDSVPLNSILRETIGNSVIQY
jgi:uridine kinase